MAGRQSSYPHSQASETLAGSPEVRVASQAPPKPPGPDGLMSGRPLMNAPLGFLEKMFGQYGDVVGMRILSLRICAIAHPEGIKHVLQDNHRNYQKSFDYKILARLLGQGLVTSEGSLWLKQRRLMQPIFHRHKVAAFGRLMAECTTGTLERWRIPARQQEPFDIVPEMMRL